MKVLAVDTAGPVIGVALRIDGETQQRTERVVRGSEARLVPWAVELCAQAGVRIADLDGIAVAVGPGAFTGLRVGLATATGLAFGAGLPVLGLSSLASRAHGLPGTVLSMLDARKSRVYAQWFRDGASLTEAVDMDPELVAAQIEGAFLATGEGASVYAELLGDRATLAADWDDPSVDALARMGEEGLLRGEGVDPVDVRPTYLRLPDARPPKFI